MDDSIDKVIFLLSTDCFSTTLLDGCNSTDLEITQKLARLFVHKIIEEGNSYFMCADFSSLRLEKTRRDFLSDIASMTTSSCVYKKVIALESALKSVTHEFSIACNTVLSVSYKLFWLDVDGMRLKLSDDLLTCISIIEPVGLDCNFDMFEWKHRWLESKSQWDLYVMSIMENIPEMPYLAFCDIATSYSQFDFLRNWRSRLGTSMFNKIIMDFIERESHSELDETNPAAAAELARVVAMI